MILSKIGSLCKIKGKVHTSAIDTKDRLEIKILFVFEEVTE